MDAIDEIIDRAIQYTEQILAQTPQHFAVAKAGLERLRDNLRLGAEDHDALRRLESFLIELDRRFAD